MEFKLELYCKFCGIKLAYDLADNTLSNITFIVEPCENCTNEALSEAWSAVKKQYSSTEVAS